ncbi:MAG TPA: hypothetical protein PLY93_03010 [Turneriella sp.]|nr:hypothetical protein [Turneriella sp.]
MKVKLTILASVVALWACTAKAQSATKYVAPVVKDNGAVVYFPPGAQGRETISTRTFGEGKEFIQIQAPAHIVATVGHSVSGGGRIVLFESADLNTA